MTINNKMKKNILLALAAIAAFASCEEQYTPYKPHEVKLSNNICLVIDSKGETPEKILVYDQKDVPVIFWKDTLVTVENVYKSDKWTTLEPKFTVCLPDVSKTALVDGKVSVEIPSTQFVSEENESQEGLFTAASSVKMLKGNYRTEFKDVMSYLNIEVDQPKVASVEIKSVAGLSLSGKVAVDYVALSADSTCCWVPDQSGEQYSTTVLKPADSTLFEPGVYRMAVLPQVIEKGLKVTFLGESKDTISTRVFAGKKTVTLKGGKTTDIAAKVLPDTFKVVVDFTKGNPFGTFAVKTKQSAQPNSEAYTFKYFYEYEGDDFDYDFTFRFCKGAAATGYYQYDETAHECIIFSNQGGVMFPAVSERYLVSVKVYYKNTSGSVISGSLQGAFAYAAANTANYLTAVSFPKTTADAQGCASYVLKSNAKLKANQTYCIRIGSPASKKLTIQSIELEYAKELK